MRDSFVCPRKTDIFFCRHKELAAAPPPLPAVREEEDDVFVVEFGETELHRQAAVKGSRKLTKKFRYCLLFRC